MSWKTRPDVMLQYYLNARVPDHSLFSSYILYQKYNNIHMTPSNIVGNLKKITYNTFCFVILSKKLMYNIYLFVKPCFSFEDHDAVWQKKI